MGDPACKLMSKIEIAGLSSSAEDVSPTPGPSNPLPSCPICLTDILDPLEKAVTGCMHTFCRACLEEWLRVKRICPLCKRRIRNYMTQIRDDADFTEVEVPPSPVHNNDDLHNFQRHERNMLHRAYLNHHQHQEHHYRRYQEPRYPYEDVEYLQSRLLGSDPAGQLRQAAPQPARQLHQHHQQHHQYDHNCHGDRNDVGTGVSTALSAQRLQQLARRGHTEDLLTELHHIADRLAETEGNRVFGVRRLTAAGGPRFRRAAATAIEDGGEAEGERRGGASAVMVIAPRGQQAREVQQRQPRPYFFRLQQRLAAAAPATAASRRSDTWNNAAAAAAAYLVPPIPAPLAQTSPFTLVAAAAASINSRLDASLATDEQAVPMGMRRRIYELGLWATGVVGGAAPGGALGTRTGGRRGAASGPSSAAAVAAATAVQEEHREQLHIWVTRELQALLGASDHTLLKALVVALVERFGTEIDWPAATEAVQRGQRAAVGEEASAEGRAVMNPRGATGTQRQVGDSGQQTLRQAQQGPRVALSPPQQQQPQKQQHRHSWRGLVGGNGAPAEEGPLASLHPFLLDRSAHFWHELRHFIMSGLSVAAYDARVQYRHDGGTTSTAAVGGSSGVARGTAANLSTPRPQQQLRWQVLAGAPLALTTLPAAASVASTARTRVVTSGSGAMAQSQSQPGGGAVGSTASGRQQQQQQQGGPGPQQRARLMATGATCSVAAPPVVVEVVDLTMETDSSTELSGSGITQGDDEEPDIAGGWRGQMAATLNVAPHGIRTAVVMRPAVGGSGSGDRYGDVGVGAGGRGGGLAGVSMPRPQPQIRYQWDVANSSGGSALAATAAGLASWPGDSVGVVGDRAVATNIAESHQPSQPMADGNGTAVAPPRNGTAEQPTTITTTRRRSRWDEQPPATAPKVQIQDAGHAMEGAEGSSVPEASKATTATSLLGSKAPRRSMHAGNEVMNAPAPDVENGGRQEAERHREPCDTAYRSRSRAGVSGRRGRQRDSRITIASRSPSPGRKRSPDGRDGDTQRREVDDNDKGQKGQGRVRDQGNDHRRHRNHGHLHEAVEERRCRRRSHRRRRSRSRRRLADEDDIRSDDGRRQRRRLMCGVTIEDCDAIGHVADEDRWQLEMPEELLMLGH
ncbi:hypothetical protein VaNZ11_003128 [Volvox africanus]|uniref:RING-type E3 ubiquitin transferase n=1 Tax=Volvox africanus TaxID=51714 RepID=A0ABQ5RTK1_9CHLO|nr:hypothetical protein VaNZ11_003128 [Volvox africanus]